MALGRQQRMGTGWASVLLAQLGLCGCTEVLLPHCWGYNYYGQTAVPATESSSIACGLYSTCGIDTDGNVWCVGGVSQPLLVPSNLTATSPAKQVVAGLNFACALLTDSTVRCFGEGNGNGETQVPEGLADVQQLTAGYSHACALLPSGMATCWGRNDYGQANAPSNLQASQIAAGGKTTCALLLSKKIECWGDEDYGLTSVPAVVQGQAHQMALGDAHACAILDNSTLVCWGLNDDGQANVPTDLGAVATITLGGVHTCAVDQAGRPRCWGFDGDGQSTIDMGQGWQPLQMCAGYHHTCMLNFTRVQTMTVTSSSSSSSTSSSSGTGSSSTTTAVSATSVTWSTTSTSSSTSSTSTWSTTSTSTSNTSTTTTTSTWSTTSTNTTWTSTTTSTQSTTSTSSNTTTTSTQSTTATRTSTTSTSTWSSTSTRSITTSTTSTSTSSTTLPSTTNTSTATTSTWSTTPTSTTITSTTTTSTWSTTPTSTTKTSTTTATTTSTWSTTSTSTTNTSTTTTTTTTSTWSTTSTNTTTSTTTLTQSATSTSATTTSTTSSKTSSTATSTGSSTPTTTSTTTTSTLSTTTQSTSTSSSSTSSPGPVTSTSSSSSSSRSSMTTTTTTTRTTTTTTRSTSTTTTTTSTATLGLVDFSNTTTTSTSTSTSTSTNPLTARASTTTSSTTSGKHRTSTTPTATTTTTTSTSNEALDPKVANAASLGMAGVSVIGAAIGSATTAATAASFASTAASTATGVGSAAGNVATTAAGNAVPAGGGAGSTPGASSNPGSASAQSPAMEQATESGGERGGQAGPEDKTLVEARSGLGCKTVQRPGLAAADQQPGLKVVTPAECRLGHAFRSAVRLLMGDVINPASYGGNLQIHERPATATAEILPTILHALPGCGGRVLRRSTHAQSLWEGDDGSWAVPLSTKRLLLWIAPGQGDEGHLELLIARGTWADWLIGLCMGLLPQLMPLLTGLVAWSHSPEDDDNGNVAPLFELAIMTPLGPLLSLATWWGRRCRKRWRKRARPSRMQQEGNPQVQEERRKRAMRCFQRALDLCRRALGCIQWLRRFAELGLLVYVFVTMSSGTDASLHALTALAIAMTLLDLAIMLHKALQAVCPRRVKPRESIFTAMGRALLLLHFLSYASLVYVPDVVHSSKTGFLVTLTILGHFVEDLVSNYKLEFEAEEGVEIETVDTNYTGTTLTLKDWDRLERELQLSGHVTPDGPFLQGFYKRHKLAGCKPLMYDIVDMPSVLFMLRFLDKLVGERAATSNTQPIAAGSGSNAKRGPGTAKLFGRLFHDVILEERNTGRSSHANDPDFVNLYDLLTDHLAVVQRRLPPDADRHLDTDEERALRLAVEVTQDYVWEAVPMAYHRVGGTPDGIPVPNYRTKLKVSVRRRDGVMSQGQVEEVQGALTTILLDSVGIEGRTKRKPELFVPAENREEEVAFHELEYYTSSDSSDDEPVYTL